MQVLASGTAVVTCDAHNIASLDQTPLGYKNVGKVAIKKYLGCDKLFDEVTGLVNNENIAN
jgi:hypothetical protein